MVLANVLCRRGVHARYYPVKDLVDESSAIRLRHPCAKSGAPSQSEATGLVMYWRVKAATPVRPV